MTHNNHKPSINDQPPEPRAPGMGTTLDLHSAFFTLQGEGMYSGLPAVFVRLAGCNLQCPGCDTLYTEGRMTVPLGGLVQRVHALTPTRAEQHYQRPALVVITGGEPFRQNISPLCAALLDFGYMVQVETNGTFPPLAGFPKPGHVKVVCSPKSGRVNDALLPYISAYKYVAQAGNMAADGLPNAILGRPDHRPARPHRGYLGPVYLTPMDEGEDKANEANMQAARDAAMAHNYIFQLQIHKFVQLP